MRAVLAFLIGASAWAQISAPRLGLIADGPRIRSMDGIKGSAVIGGAIDTGRDLNVIAISPRQDYAIASAADNGDVLLIAATTTHLGAASSPDKIVISPTGSSASLWFGQASHFQVITGLPANPSMREVDATFLGTPRTFAVADDGRIAGAWDTGVFSFAPDGSVSQLQADDGVSAMAYYANRPDLVLATSTRVFSFSDSAGSATLYDSSNQPITAAGLAISMDNRRAILADSNGAIYSIDLAAGPVSIIQCDCNPEGVWAVNNSLFRLTTQTVKLFDADSNTILAVPGAAPADPLAITTANFSITAGKPFSGNLTASGGAPPYLWTVRSGKLPTGLELDPTGAISGTPTGDVFAPPVFAVTDAGGQQATRPVAFLAFTETPPPLTITVPSTAGLAQQPAMSISIPSAFSSDISGTATLAFSGSDNMVQFGTGGRSVNFTIPAGSTQATFSGKTSVAVLTGTVAGTITITASITSATPAPAAATATITTAKTPPVIDSVTLTQSSGMLTVVVTGYTPTRDMTLGIFSFVAGANATLAQTNISVQLTSAFASWFGNSASAATGGQFTLTVPFTVQGNASNVVRVGVDLTNSAGVSNAVSSQ